MSAIGKKAQAAIHEATKLDGTQANAEHIAPEQSVLITDLDQFINQLVHWHNGAKARVQHAAKIPNDGSITMEYDGQDRIMTGELHTGFLMGLFYAYAELGTLPFGYEEISLDEASEPPAA